MTKKIEILSKYDSVQSLRFFAASLVMVTHITYQINTRLLDHSGDYWMTGKSGVDIFFVISGFVMAYTTKIGGRRDWANFFIRRIIRIAPLYWIATALKISLVFLFAELVIQSNNNPNHIIASLAFIPWYDAGKVQLPVVPAGWTLNFEMFYYVIFSLALFLKYKPLIFCSAIFILYILCNKLFLFGGIAEYYANPIIIEFILGMLIVPLIKKESGYFDFYIGILMIFIGYCTIFFTPYFFLDKSIEHYRWLVWGGAGVALIYGGILIEKKELIFIQTGLYISATHRILYIYFMP